MNNINRVLIYLLVGLVALEAVLQMAREFKEMTAADILDDDVLMESLDASNEYQTKPTQFKSLTIPVPARVIFKHVLFVAMTMDGLIWRWRDGRHNKIREIMEYDQTFSNMTYSVSSTRAGDVSINKDTAYIYHLCDKHTEKRNGCSSKWDYSIWPISSLLNASGWVELTVKCRDFNCGVHFGAKGGQFRGHQRQLIATEQPRNTQLNLASQHHFQRNSNNHNIPSHAVAKTARAEEAKKSYLHSDLAHSIRLYILSLLNNPNEQHLDEIYRGPLHLTLEPEFAVSYFTEKSSLLAIKCGQFDEPGCGLDSSVHVVLDYIDPITKVKQEMLCTPFVCRSPANKESFVTFILFTPHRNYSIFNKHFNFWVDFMATLNGGILPIFRLTRSDCAPFWKGICLKLNGIVWRKYLEIFFSYMAESNKLLIAIDNIKIELQLTDEQSENNVRIAALIKQVHELAAACPDNRFLHCSIHVISDIETHFEYNDTKLQGKSILKEFLISFSKKNIYEMRIAKRFNFIECGFSFYNVILRIPSFNLNEKSNVVNLCISWRELLRLPFEPPLVPIYLEFKYDTIAKVYVATLFNMDKFTVGVLLQQPYVTITLPGFNLSYRFKVGKNVNLSEIPNGIQHISAPEYMNKTKFLTMPLQSHLVVGEEVKTENNQFLENKFKILKYYDFATPLRLDKALIEIVEKSECKIGRALTELQVDYTKQKQKMKKGAKDPVSKKCRDRMELALYKLFTDCIRYCWVYDRQQIVDYYVAWNQSLDKSYGINFKLTHVTALNMKNKLPKSLHWKQTVEKWLLYEIKKQQEKNKSIVNQYNQKQNQTD